MRTYGYVSVGGTGKDVVHRPHADGLIANMGRLPMEDGMWEEPWERDEGWGYLDAEARLKIARERERDERDGYGFLEREGWFHWRNQEDVHFWMNSNKCAALMEEVKVALKASLNRTVASLENDRWMFEGDARPRF